MAEHKIEEMAKVYLRLNDDGTAWEIDHVTFDGSPLDGYDKGPIDDECQCDAVEEHLAMMQIACDLDLPTGQELTALLVEALGEYEGEPLVK